jgi:hypothetical protein
MFRKRMSQIQSVRVKGRGERTKKIKEESREKKAQGKRRP